MRDRALPLVLMMLLSVGVQAQVVWQPTPPPLVTAENTPWFHAGEPVQFEGDLYYPAGAVQFFNRYQMVRAGSFRGIPLYIDTMLQPNSIVFIPLPGERMQPYERPRTGELAGTTGSRGPSFPPQVPSPAVATDRIRQAPAPPSYAPFYEPVPPQIANELFLRPAPQPTAVGTSGRIAAAPAPSRVTTLRPPTGSNVIWIEFDGRRWVSAGKAIDYNAATLTQVGTYHGWSVYTRSGDRSTIYVPTTPGKLARYKLR